jgi:hypothetical protein
MARLVRGYTFRVLVDLFALSMLVCAASWPASVAQEHSAFKGTWIKTNNPTQPHQLGIGVWIKFDAETPPRVYLSWAAPAVVADAQGQHGANVVWRSEVSSCWYDMKRLGTKLTVRLTKSDPPGVCLEDSVFELVQPPPPPQPAAEPRLPPKTERTERPVPERRETTDDRVVRFVDLITDHWNRGVLQPALFADSLVYYGKLVPRSHAINETSKYFQRWYSREFVVDHNSIFILDLGGGLLSVTYRYDFRGARVGATTSGTGQYFLKLRRSGSSFQIMEIRDDYTARK